MMPSISLPAQSCTGFANANLSTTKRISCMNTIVEGHFLEAANLKNERRTQDL
jgi:hypothetical protein